FFFSSRRRHTRFDCDWSSDVCSSDLWRLSSLPSLIFSATEDLITANEAAEALLGHAVTVLARKKLADGSAETPLSALIRRAREEIGRASCRERVERSGDGVTDERKTG